MIQARGVAPLLQVFDMTASREFYCGKLGFEVACDPTPDWCMLRLGDAFIMLNTKYESHEGPEGPDETAARMHGDVILYFDCPNVEETYRYLVSKGVEAQAPVVTWYGMKQVHLKDPDGYPLCFQFEAAKESETGAETG
jgi:hypothetical protein